MKSTLHFSILATLMVITPLISFGQCNTTDIYNNDSLTAVCFDTTSGKVLNCYSNNVPDHTDTYNSPFTLTASDEEYSMCLYPDTAASFTPLYETTEDVGCTYTYTFGISTNGVKYDPSSAEYFEDTGTGENNLDWHVEARYIFSANFGNNGGHLNPFGEYHYHDVPSDYFANDLSIDGSAHSPIVGWAADGFPIYYKYVFSDPDNISSSITSLASGFTLKTGSRPGNGITAPSGSYTGLYYEDYEYSTSTLDECNGRWGKTPEFPSGTYYYVLTDNYPYIPRCFKGTVVDNTFRVGPSASCPASTASTDCSEAPALISGCMDPFSCNYNPSATSDDGSCDYSYNYQDLTVSQSTDYTAPSGAVLNATGIHYDTVVVAGCDTIYIIDLTINTSCSATITLTDPTTCGGSNGAISFGMPSGTPPYNYSIDNGANFTGGMPPTTFSSLSSGTYYTVMTDGSGCTAYVNVDLSDPSTITYSTTTSAASCGASDGTITITASGGTGSLTYSKDGGTSFQVSNIFSGLAAGNYGIEVKDASGCTATGSASVASSSTLSIDSVVAPDLSCEGSTNGTIDIYASGGTGSLQYSIDSGVTYASTSNFTALAGGTYHIFVKDASVCAISESTTISEPIALDPEITAWILGDGSTGRYWDTASASIITTTHFANVKSVSYTNDYVYINSSGIPDYVYGPFLDGNPSMPGDVDYLFQLPRNPIEEMGTKEVPSTGQIGVFINGVPIYNYSDDQSYNNMGIWNQNAVVMENDGFDAQKGHPSPNMSSINNSYYHHHQSPTTYNSALANVMSDVGDTYPSTGLYDIDSTEHSPLIGYAFDGFPVYGAYGYDNTDGTGGIVRINSSYVKRSIADRTTLADGTVLSPAQYGPAINTSFPLGSYKEDYDYDASNGHLDEYNGRWCVTPEYPNGTYCYFATVDEDWNSAYPYIVGDGYFGVVIDDNFPSGTGGNGSVVADNSAITWDGTSFTALSLITNTMDASCGVSDGSVTLTGSGGNDAPFQYAFNGGSLQSSGAFTSISAGEYEVIVEDAGGCQLLDTITITSPGSPSLDSSSFNEPLCNSGTDGSITISASGGTGAITYSKDNGGTYQSGATFASVGAGTYNVVIKDASNCTVSSSITVTEPAAMAYSSSESDPTCNGNTNGTINLSLTAGGTGAITYSIDNGSSAQSTGTFSMLDANTYNILIEDANGCNASGNITLTNPTVVGVSNSVVDAGCGASDGSISASGSGGDGSYMFSIDGGSLQSSGSFNSLAAGSYTIRVEDGNSCFFEEDVDIVNPGAPSLGSPTTGDPTCFGMLNGTVTISATGGTGVLSYTIDGGSNTQSTGSFTGLMAGNYTIEVMDVNSCTDVVGVTLTDPTQINASVSSTNILCFGNGDGNITITGMGGTGALEYSTDGGMSYQSSGSFTNLTPGTYQNTVKDANGCVEFTDSATLSQPMQIMLSGTATDVTTLGGADGAIDLTASGGTGSLLFDWDNDGTGDTDDSEDLVGLIAGTYMVSVIDSNNCTNDTSFVILDGTVGIEELTTFGLEIYPNPASNQVMFELDNQQPFTYQVYNGIGKLIQSGNANGKEVLNVSSMATGVYQVIIMQQTTRIMTRFVKE